MFTQAPSGFLPVIVAGLISVPVGMLWFSKLMFAKPWMRMNKLSEQQMKKDGMSPAPFIVSILSGLLMAFTLWVLIGVMQLSTGPAISLGFLLWLGFDFFPGFTHHMFAKRPVALLLINSGYELTNTILMAWLLSNWN